MPSYRIGTTSYIYPDDIIPNIYRLKDRVDDVELLLFESDDDANIHSTKDIVELKRLSREFDLTYTPHLPLDLQFGGASKSIRDESVNIAASIIDILSEIDPYCYILHLNITEDDKSDIPVWQKRSGDSIKSMLSRTKCESNSIALENLNYPFEFLEDIIAEYDLSICIDIGHLIIAGNDVEEHLNRYIDSTRVIHLHGVDKERDHVSIRHIDKRLLMGISEILKEKKYGGVLTMEIFSEADFEESLTIVQQYFI